VSTNRPQVITPEAERDRAAGLLGSLRALFGRLDLLIGVLLAAFLLPLILGPIVAIYQFARAGQYLDAIAIMALTIVCYSVSVRAVRRGEFGPGTVFTVLVTGAIIFYVAIHFRR